MKYWRGYLVAAIMAVIAGAAVAFAKAHPVLIDMIYPYLTRIYASAMADWTGAVSVCLWQVILLLGIVALIASIVMMVILRWNFVQWLGWLTATISCVALLNTVVWSLGAYASPLADDIRLEVSEYTVSELVETTNYFRDKANELAEKISRDENGLADFGTFEDVAALSYDGFRYLTYEENMSVFASAKAPVKKLGMSSLFLTKGEAGMTVTLTGESAVNPRTPAACLPFAMCKELSHRISIYSDADAQFAAFLACIHNENEAYQYSGYLMAYYYCYGALASISTSTAQAAARNSDKGVTRNMRFDLDECMDFYGERVGAANVQAEANITDDKGEITLISFSSYNSVTDLFASWYIQEFILPAYQEEVQEFDPLDETQVDLTGIVNAPTP